MINIKIIYYSPLLIEKDIHSFVKRLIKEYIYYFQQTENMDKSRYFYVQNRDKFINDDQFKLTPTYHPLHGDGNEICELL